MTSDRTSEALITAEELAELIPISRQQIWRAVRDKKIVHYRCGRRVFFDFAEVKEALKVSAGQGNGSGEGEEREVGDGYPTP